MRKRGLGVPGDLGWNPLLALSLQLSKSWPEMSFYLHERRNSYADEAFPLSICCVQASEHPTDWLCSSRSDRRKSWRPGPGTHTSSLQHHAPRMLGKRASRPEPGHNMRIHGSDWGGERAKGAGSLCFTKDSSPPQLSRGISTGKISTKFTLPIIGRVPFCGL